MTSNALTPGPLPRTPRREEPAMADRAYQQIRDAIERGITYLKRQQQPNGGFSIDPMTAYGMQIRQLMAAADQLANQPPAQIPALSQFMPQQPRGFVPQLLSGIGAGLRGAGLAGLPPQMFAQMSAANGFALRHVEAARVWLNPDCGFATAAGLGEVAVEVVWLKLRALTEGARLATKMRKHGTVDLDAAWRLATELDDPACVIVKHTNPCGTGIGRSPLEAYERAWACDPTSAFGGIIAFNEKVNAAAAKKLTGQFVEAVIAPGFEKAALEVLGKKTSLRVMNMDTTAIHKASGFDLRRVMGGLLAQQWDLHRLERDRCEVVTKRAPSEEEWAALLFAWTVVKHVKSNAIVYANATQTVGVGAGQMSRVDSARIAAQKAVLPLKGTVVASDAFFPFRDGLDEIAKAGATAVIQPGGSVKDEEVIAAADEHKMAMVFTGVRHFKH